MHLWQGINRNGAASCFNQLLLHDVIPRSPLEREVCDRSDANYIKEKKKAGKSPYLTEFRAYRVHGPLPLPL